MINPHIQVVKPYGVVVKIIDKRINEMKWILAKTKINEQNFKNVEQELGVEFPSDFKDTVLEYNGASPQNMIYDTKNTKGRVAEYLLSFSSNDKDNIIDTYNMIKERLEKGLIPVIRDPFGNFICFNFSKEANGELVFWNHENNDVEYISKTFLEFVGKLYD